MARKKQQSLGDKIASFFQLNESTLSTVLGALVVVIIGILIFNYFRSSTPTDEVTFPEEEVVIMEEGEVQYTVNEEGKKVPTNLPETYTVKAGDQLWDIAEKYYGSGYNWVDIAEANNLSNANILLVDQQLVMPEVEIRKPAIEAETAATITADTYTVQKGDHLWKIALLAYGDGYQWVKIAEANNIASPDYIEIGQTLKLPR